ncbi:GNAT family N-acetyltransferase [Plastorhodobacter daqingensis]|uniref:GNAT family N-acetyltransferase n=1 Tax=Plastorhodobacter daqingensis TaxID=1387281 RepID=A0ABW2UHQ6_9RHOB
MPELIRPARPADAEGIARTHSRSRAETYSGLLPEERIHEADNLAHFWHGILSGPRPPFVAVAQMPGQGGRICGFVSTRAQDDPELAQLGFRGEISALYLERAAQGQGLGRKLFEAARRDLAARCPGPVSLWVLAANAPARAFYTAMGGKPILTRSDPGQPALAEWVYGWA